MRGYEYQIFLSILCKSLFFFFSFFFFSYIYIYIESTNHSRFFIVLEKIAVAGEQYLDNAAIQGVHNPTTGQNHPGEVPDYAWLGIQSVHNPTARQKSQNHLGEVPEVPYYDWLGI